MTSNSPATRYHVILPDLAGAKILAQETAAGLVLPTWTSSEPTVWEETRAVTEAMRRLLGVSVAQLRACRLSWSAACRDSYYVADLLEAGWQPPPAFAWIAAADVAHTRWGDPADQEVAREWVADTPAPGRVAWYRPGWFWVARSWIDAALAAAGLTRINEVEQLRSWERSAIMRVETCGGRLYFKAVPRQWGHEPALTAYLAARFPRLMPAVVAADPAVGRLLVREFSGSPLRQCEDSARWEAAYAALGSVQRELASALPELRACGVSVRDPGALLAEIPALLADRRRMRAGMEGGLSDDEIAALQAAAPALSAACRRLAAGPIPLSLDHGDFWPGNIYADGTSVTLFDWSDATLTHPFFSLVMAADEIADSLSDQPDAADRVIDAYLAEWMDYGSREELRAIFDDVMLVAPLHLALMYRSVYLPAMEFVDELDRMTPHFLRWLAGRVGSL